MNQSQVVTKIREQFSDSIISYHSHLGDETVVVSRKSLVEVARFLRDELGFNFLIDLTAVDNWKTKPRFEVVYHFFALATRQRLRVKVPVPEPDPVVDTLSNLWPGANWFEREVYDMYGIRFAGHPNLQRILMYPEFKGHPLRKDYPIDRRQPLVGPQD
jgi:NADH-quinone oxidoreductase subunit C